MSMNEKLLADLRANPTPENVRTIATLTGLPLVALRKRLIAEYMRGGATIDDAASRFGVSIPAVRTACKEVGVKLPPGPKAENSSQPNYPVIAAIVNGLSDSAISKSLCCTRQRSQQIRAKLLAAGAKLRK